MADVTRERPRDVRTAKGKRGDETRKLVVSVDPELYAGLQAEAQRMGMTLSDLVRTALKHTLEAIRSDR